MQHLAGFNRLPRARSPPGGQISALPLPAFKDEKAFRRDLDLLGGLLREYAQVA
jgi:hypothetical protein